MPRRAPAVATALDDRILAVLRDEGPLPTGVVTELTGPHYQQYRLNHGGGRWDKWQRCPDCRCTETRELNQSWASPRVRSRLLSLERRGLVVRIKSPSPNRTRGDLWVYVEGGDA